MFLISPFEKIELFETSCIRKKDKRLPFTNFIVPYEHLICSSTTSPSSDETEEISILGSQILDGYLMSKRTTSCFS